MNWLGDLITPRLRPTDEVLDLGCGIMQPTGGRLPVKAHVGVDTFTPYLDRVGPPYIVADVSEVTARPNGLPDKSFDVVLMLDVVEHMDKADALAAIAGAEAVARREVIVFTPDGFCPQEGWDAWGMGHNEAQAHRCEFTTEELLALGYECSRHPNGTLQHGPINSVFAVKTFPGPTDWLEQKRAANRKHDCLAAVERWKQHRCLTHR